MKTWLFTFLLLLLFCNNESPYDLVFTISQEKIVVGRGSEVLNFSYQNAYELEAFLDSLTEMFKDSVRCGLRDVVYKKITANIIEDIPCHQLLKSLETINNCCYNILSEITLLGHKIYTINDMNPAIYPVWKKSDSLNVEQIKRENVSMVKIKGNVRLFVNDTTSVKSVLKCILKCTEIDSCTYQICSKSKCLGMNGIYTDEIIINDLIENVFEYQKRLSDNK